MRFSGRFCEITVRKSVSARTLKESGDALGKLFFVAISRAVDLDEVKRNLAAHLEYIKSLEDEDKLFCAGPILTSDAEQFEGDGLLILKAQTPLEARGIADRDPMHQSGARVYELIPWILNDGSINIRVLLSRSQRFLY
jgi:hypothetical protein